MIACSCPHCHKSFHVKDQFAGKKGKCPGCGHSVVVPVPAAVAPSPLPRGNAALPEEPGALSSGETAAAPAGAEAVTLPPRDVPPAPAAGFRSPHSQDAKPPPGPARSGPAPELVEFLAPAQQPDELGRLGPYQIQQVLGAGGVGTVYKAYDPALQRPVALKVMQPGLAQNTAARERFLREARAAAAIKHDNIVTIFQVGEDRSVPFLAMEFLEGQPLDQRLQREGKLPLREVLRIGREAAEGLAAAHKGGLIHRDIKPANLWLEGERGRVKILDFGLARAVRDQAHLTQAGVIMGTPAYMAPEQASAGSVDHRCDLFSLGCVLYQLCTGELPFKGTDTVSFLYAIATEIPRPPEEINPQVPPALSALVLRLLAKKAPERPASAQEVAEALASIQAGLEAKTEPRRSQPHQTQAWSNEPLQREATEEKGGKPRLSTSVSREGKEERGRPLARKPERGQSQRTLSSKGRKGVGDRAAWGLSGRRVWLVAAAVCGLVLLLVGIVVIIRNREGKEVARIVVPEGGSVETKTVDDGQPGAKPPGALPARYKNSLGMEFVLVPKGKFLMGGGGGQGILGTKEVEIPHDFYLGVYEVTQGEWQAVSGANPSEFSRNGSKKEAVKDILDEELKRFPVEQVSWIDAQMFLDSLNAREKEAGWVYRLPKEAEWEYACRGGPRADKFEYGFDFYFEKPTNQLLPDQANFVPKKGEGLQRPCKVGSYKPNSLGLYDMHGNVWEWYDDEVRTPEEASPRVSRGGGWSNVAGGCRAGSRCVRAPSDRGRDLGLRLARVSVIIGGK